MATHPSRVIVRRCTAMPCSSLSHSVRTRCCGSATASASAVGRDAPCIQSVAGSPAIVQKVGARSTSPTARVTTDGATPAEGAGRQMSGSRIKPSTWYGPLNSRPKSPWSSPWSVVNTTSRSSSHPRAETAARIRPTASSMSSTSTALRAHTSRSWSAVRVAGTHEAGAS